MKSRLAFIALAMLVGASGSALAAGTSATLSWQLASTNVDGSPRAAADIKETLIEWLRPGTSAVVGSVRVSAPATTAVVPGLTCGKFDFRATTVLNSLTTSSPSPKVAYDTAVECKPNPPGGLGAS